MHELADTCKSGFRALVALLSAVLARRRLEEPGGARIQRLLSPGSRAKGKKYCFAFQGSSKGSFFYSS